jgi:hypothetical protein
MWATARENPMLTIAMALLLQVQPTEADISTVVDRLLAMEVHPDSVVGGAPVGDRPLFLDVARTVEAFREELLPHITVPEPSAPLEGLERAHIPARLEDVIKCERVENPLGGSPRTCAVDDDGIVVAVGRATRAEEPGVYVFRFDVTWTTWSEIDRNQIKGIGREVYMERRDGQWEVVRLGRLFLYLF